jgi:nitrogen fixation protein FixH
MIRGEFTGRRMAIIMVAFFGVVVVVNLTMATLATRTFGGTVVDNSYVASQNFNSWLRNARNQAGLQWKEETRLDASGHLVSQVHSPSGPVRGAVVEAHASHPLGRAPENRIMLASQGDGQYRSAVALPPGRWIVRLSVRQDGREARFLREVSR